MLPKKEEGVCPGDLVCWEVVAGVVARASPEQVKVSGDEGRPQCKEWEDSIGLLDPWWQTLRGFQSETTGSLQAYNGIEILG